MFQCIPNFILYLIFIALRFLCVEKYLSNLNIEICDNLLYKVITNIKDKAFKISIASMMSLCNLKDKQVFITMTNVKCCLYCEVRHTTFKR